jgi:pilus assembly protein CpaF
MKIDELAKTNSVWNLYYELSTKKGITEIMINGSNNVYVERENEFVRLNVNIIREDMEKFCQDVAKYNQKVFNKMNPIIDGRMPDGSRINVIASLYTTGTHVITIRKYLKTIRNFEGNENLFHLTNPKWIELFQYMVKTKFNIIVSGGTGVGKTTFLNLLLQEIPKDERVITIEDTRELQFNLTNVVRLESKNEIADEQRGLNIRQLLKNTLRMRPDRIILGEIRSEEAFDLLQAMNTGHDGSMATIHSNSPAEAVIRLENLFFLAGYDIPIRAIRHQIQKAVDFIIQIGRNKKR